MQTSHRGSTRVLVCSIYAVCLVRHRMSVFPFYSFIALLAQFEFKQRFVSLAGCEGGVESATCLESERIFIVRAQK
jgi:hypothetical protein